MKLQLTIKKIYFDEILLGLKTEEYRLIKSHWTKRIINKNYTHIVFTNGYNKNSSKLEAEYLGYETRKIKHEFFGNKKVECFVLKIKNPKMIYG